jgi:type I restriction enzyme M protein
LKNHTGFNNTKGKTDKKEIEATQDFKDWKTEISNEYNQRINDLKETMADLYFEEKQKSLEDYPIFMAIAEEIGYDATGKSTTQNELVTIGEHLKKFIKEINSEAL